MKARLGLILLVALSLAGCGEDYSGNMIAPAFDASAGGIPFLVNTTDDLDDGVCDAAHCSLREAITAANADQGYSMIGFRIPGTGPHTIQPGSELPYITAPVMIDGYSQPGAKPNSNGSRFGSNAIIMVELNGSNSYSGGLTVATTQSEIRGLAIHGFGGSAIHLSPLGSANLVAGNFVGLGAVGFSGLGNGGYGIVVQSPNNRVGGTMPADRNVISGNEAGGVFLGAVRGVDANTIQGNLIGTNATGTAAFANSIGIRVRYPATATLIGGTTPGSGNVISGNTESAVSVWDVGFHKIQGNLVGTQVDGIGALGNGGAGVFVYGSDNLIGGKDQHAGNIIAFNKDGIFVSVGTRNAILSNRIHSNDAMGIDLGRAYKQSDPVLTGASALGGTFAVAGTLNSTPESDFLVQVFANDACDASGHGEGQYYVGSLRVTTDCGGDAAFEGSLFMDMTVPGFVTATATDMEGNTSEFSACLAVVR